MMRVSEVYASVQGEGPRVGETTVFTRFGGCNLRCPGWPCDTQHAIDPAYRKEWEKHSVDDLAERIYTVGRLAGARRVTFTGGEPFLQPKADLHELTSRLRADGYQLEAFTNGTIPYPTWALNGIDMIMDWKLPGSGEDPLNHTRRRNLELLDSYDAVKFVIKDFDDFAAAQALWYTFIRDKSSVQVYYGRVWDTELTNATLASWVMADRLPWKLNVQLHNYIWDPQERGR